MTSNPHILYRDREHRIIGGVCAGIAEYFGLSRLVVRLAVLASLFFFTLPTFVIYVVAMFFLKDRPGEARPRDPEEQELYQSLHRSPRRTAENVRRRMAALDKRIRDLEAYLTSRRYTLNRAFENLDQQGGTGHGGR